MTDAQARVLAFVAREIDKNGAPPTYRAIATHFGFKSTRAAQDHVAVLVRKGKLIHIPGVSRGLRIAEGAGPLKANALAVPILGTVAASTPREAWQVSMGTVPYPRELSRGKEQDPELFALRIVGDSMMDAGILAGDVVIVRQQKTAAHGDIVVAMLDGESTVKRLSKVGSKIHLVPENRRMKPIAVTQGELVIQGRVVGVQRFYR
jgi:repressor LexA